MSELIVVAVIATIAIVSFAVVTVAQINANQRERESAREERMRLTLQLMSRNAAEFSLAQSKISDVGAKEPEPYREPVVGM